MNLNNIKIIGKKQSSRNGACTVYINKITGIDNILNNAEEIWNDFDKWNDLSLQKLVFDIAVKVSKGNKFDICCDCCDYTYVSHHDFRDSLKQKCNGVKIGFIIEKIVDEIIIAKARRENDGTYIN